LRGSRNRKIFERCFGNLNRNFGLKKRRRRKGEKKEQLQVYKFIKHAQVSACQILPK